MAKDDVVQSQLKALQDGVAAVQASVIGATYDMALADAQAAVPAPAPVTEGFTQADLDAAVAAAQGVDAQALSDAKAQAASDLAAVQSALDAMTGKEKLEEQAVADVQAKVLAVQASFNAVMAILIPAPAPVAPVAPSDAPAPASDSAAPAQQ